MYFIPLMLICGVFWMMAYVLIIKRGFQDQTYGMPFVALCFNISWEFIFSFIKPHAAPHIYTNLISFFLDLIILFQLLYFWKYEFKNLTKQSFYIMFFSTLIISFFMVLYSSKILNDQIGFYIAFIQNLLMSILFNLMLINRKDIRGQSIYIALFKMIGTLMSSLAFFLYDPIFKGTALMNIVYSLIFMFDLVYIMLFYRKCKELGVNPWIRY